MSIANAERLARALRSLDGLSLGDAFGDRYFAKPAIIERLIELRALAPEPWRFTDDTVMAMSIVDVLRERGEVDRDRLAAYFAARYRFDPGRAYGRTAETILERIAAGESWRAVAGSVFGGGGSMGNGGAMRAAPIGAYFHDDPDRVALEARRSAEVTHAHAEGQAGAVAVALAAASVARGDAPRELFAAVLARTPAGATRDGVERAAELALDADVRTAGERLGNGTAALAHDTVPFSLWCVARHRDDFAEAMWATVSGLGDRDTTCAIVGGVLACDPRVPIPAGWLRAREPLDRLARHRPGATGPGWSTRSATAADEPWLDDLRRAVYASLFERTWGGWDEARHRRHFGASWERGGIEVVEVDGEAVGMLQVRERDGEVELLEIQIAPEHQNRGLGTRVLRDLLARADERGMDVVLATGLHNVGALRLYLRLGFEETERTATHVHLRFRAGSP